MRTKETHKDVIIAPHGLRRIRIILQGKFTFCLIFKFRFVVKVIYGTAVFIKSVFKQCRTKGNIGGGARERRRREPLGGCGGMLPQKILKSRALEMLFPAFSKSYL